MDFRKRENRRESFIRYFALSLKAKDCDPSIWLSNYLNERYEHNIEQMYWFAWLYGNTYHLPTAWVILNEFPDFELVTTSRLSDWNSKNYKRLRYQTDTKWNKGYMPEMFESYKTFIGNMGQKERFDLLTQSTPEANFDTVWEAVNENLYKFGRYSSWFYIQQLKATCGLNVEPSDLKLKDYSGSRSHRNGLLFALGRDEEYDQKLSKEAYQELEVLADELLTEMQTRYPELKADRFLMETCLCAYKKLFRVRDGRYIGYYLDRQCEEIKQIEKDGWFGIQWNVLWQARESCLESRFERRSGISKEEMKFFTEQGIILNADYMYADAKAPEREVSLFDF